VSGPPNIFTLGCAAESLRQVAEHIDNAVRNLRALGRHGDAATIEKGAPIYRGLAAALDREILATGLVTP
jgi:hypothetical protein